MGVITSFIFDKVKNSETSKKLIDSAKSWIEKKLDKKLDSQDEASEQKVTDESEEVQENTVQAGDMNIAFPADASDSAEQKVFNLATLKFVYDSAFDNYHFNASEVNEKITQLANCEEELAQLDVNADDYDAKVEEVFSKYDSGIKDAYTFALDTYTNYVQTVENAGEDFDYNTFCMQNIDAAYAFGDVDADTYSKYLAANDRALVGVDASEIEADPSLSTAMAQGMAAAGVGGTIEQTNEADTETQQTIVTNIVPDESLKDTYGEEIAQAMNLSLIRFGLGQARHGLVDPGKYSELYSTLTEYVDAKLEIEKKAQDKEKELIADGKSEADAKTEAAEFVKGDLESLEQSYSIEMGDDKHYVASTFDASYKAVKEFNKTVESEGVDKAIESQGLEPAYACGAIDYDQYNAKLVEENGDMPICYICSSIDEYNQAIAVLDQEQRSKDAAALVADIEAEDDSEDSLSYAFNG